MTPKVAKPLTPAQLHNDVRELDRTLQERKGPWNKARARALMLDDHARTLQDKARLFTDRAALAHAKSLSGPHRPEQVKSDRSRLVEDRSRLLQDKSRLFADRAKLINGEARHPLVEPDVPRSEVSSVRSDKKRLLHDRSRMYEDKSLLLRDSGDLVADYGQRVGGGDASPANEATVREDKEYLHKDHKRLRQDFHKIYEDRRQLHSDEHSTVGDIRGGRYEKKGHPSFDSSERLTGASPHRRQISSAFPVAQGGFRTSVPSRFWLGIMGGILLCVGSYMLSRQFCGPRKDPRGGADAAGTGDRIPLRTGDPRTIPKGSADL
eukprot:CAMPEP_0114143036 /NCGR_PEP_ID=MMETSP0043_2-20121206/18767_1 /TAXON_ID=464988 /ORGANISM="Hemiselmis andersenii, Strain CCMP644" /LENGTH=321 /DNA_ID=CAMNT_0001237297 /DNA_START=106 /DNA_END=1071 /DNA_ORIENTATION=-